MSKTEHISFAGLLGGKSDSAVPLPAPSTTASYNLTPGAYTQFLFRMNDVQDVAMDSTTGALRMNLANGSTILVQNFKDLARSAETCGRDTVLQFMRDETSAAGQTTTKIVNIAPDLLLKTLDPTVSPDGLTILTMPAPGVTREVVIVPGGKYRFDFDWANAAKTEDGTNVMLSFKNGGLVILRDFVPVMQGEMPAKMSLTDGTVIDASKLIITACTPTESPVAKLANIEPASGEHHAATIHPKQVAHTPRQDSAVKVANIEPAAGDGTPGQSGNRGSAGFSSGIDDALLNGLNPLGPLGPTSLTYDTPRLPEQIVLRGNGTTGTPVIPPLLPPPTPTLIAQDARVYEDGSVGLSVTTTAPAGTTTLLTISGFPAGWVVDAGLGIFNATTRTWTISVPAGATFTGGPVIHPPTNSDGDIPRLDVRAVATSSVTGLSSTATEDIRVITDAVADIPDLTASITNVTGMVAGLSIATAPTDLDGSESITAVYVGPLPAGFTLNKGALQSDGRYLLNPSDLANLQITAPNRYNGTVNFNVTTVVTETKLSDTEFDLTNNTATRTVPVAVQFVFINGTPVIGDGSGQVDETNLWTASSIRPIVTGTLNSNFGSDGAGTITPTGASSFSATGSMTNGQLTIDGYPVIVTLVGNTYKGQATWPDNGTVRDIFDLTVNADGSYVFNLTNTLDHADKTNPNDFITLNFGVKIIDRDGDIDTGVISINVLDDAPIAQDDNAVVNTTGIVTGNVLLNDVRSYDDDFLTSVTVNGVIKTLNLTGTTDIVGTYGTFTINSNGGYTYTARNGVTGSDVLTYTLTDIDGDQSTAKLTVGVNDGTPTIGDSLCEGDETILNRETLWFTGDYTFNYGSDGPGTVTLDQFAASGSLMNGVLSSGGIPVVVTPEGNDFVGRAGNVIVFKMMVNTAAATYRFEQYQALDHANGSNPNDVIALDFGIKITDKDGDTDTGMLRITLADDAPIAQNDTAPAISGGGVVTGNVMANDTRGADDVTTVISVTVNGVVRAVASTGNTVIDGAFGSLTIAANGAYSYAAKNGANGGDIFTYTIRDFDGDQSSANLTFGTSDGTPTIGDSLCQGDESILNKEPLWFTGDYAFNYGSDGPGAVTLDQFTASGSLMNGVLSSGGIPVVVTPEGNDFVGRAGNVIVFKMMVNTAAATYRFEQYQALDHANGSNPNDVIALDFGIKITDKDGDTDTGMLRITLADDAPIAQNDTAPAISGGGVVTGNVMANDTRGADDVTTVISVTVNGVVRAVASTGNTVIDGAFGSLTIAANGAYSYAAKNGANGGDIFTYTIRDFDGDQSSATLTIGTADGAPSIGNASGQVDETNLWAVSVTRPIVTGKLVSDFGSDGAGTIVPSGVSSFLATGSLTNGQLTMGGLPVVVTLVGNTYKGQVTWPDDGTKGGIFDLIVNADGSYEFKLYNTLDHANTTNPNDAITLNFGVKISDRDGDTDIGVISINVLDDAPIASDDTAVVNAAGVATGRVIDNDYYSYDDMQVTSVTVNGVTMTPPDDPDNGRAILVGTYGTFAMDSNGVYTYTARNGVTGSDVLTYTLTDIDGDQSTAKLTVGVNDGIPTIGDDIKSIDETNLGPIGINGALAADYGTNGAGSIIARANSFSAAGSLRNGILIANGQEIAVTLSGKTWTGATIANGTLASVVLFTMVLFSDGTYSFTLNNNLDHANASDPNDIITLSFGAVITDRDGDTDTGTITINVVDDAPVARDDTVSASFNHVGTGNVLANDTSTEDPIVTRVVFNNVAHNVVAGTATVVTGDHGTLAIEQNGHYTYTPYDATTETICINPVASDVSAANDSDFSRNGITVTAISPNTGATQGDLTWITGNINDPDHSWFGEQGVGIAGAGNNFINGTSEGLRLVFDTPQDDLTITISGFNSMSDFVDKITEAPLHARVYLDNGSIANIVLGNGWSSGYGLTDYTLTAAQFGGRNITSVDMFSVESKADWNLYNVSYDAQHGAGTDIFQYTATDRDGDAASASLHATNTGGVASGTTVGSQTFIDVADSVQSAINDYVVSTTDQSVFSTVRLANDSYMETSTYMSVIQDDLNQQTAA